MTSTPSLRDLAARSPARRVPANAGAWLDVALLVGAMFTIAGVRWLAMRAGIDGLIVGAAFGALLVGLTALAGRRGRATAGQPRVTRPALIGLAGGFLLVALAELGPLLAGVANLSGLGRPAAPFGAWVAITIAVATAEEVLLRGVLLDRLGRLAGVVPAIAVTSLVFALLHVPVYGWHVVPLDLAVGILLAGLRLAAGSLVAPVIAHAVADLATWWL